MIPGLWDMHVHTTVAAGRTLLGLYVANGVTGVRDMAGEWDTLTDVARRDRGGASRGTSVDRVRPVSRGRRRADSTHSHAQRRRSARRRGFAREARRRFHQGARTAHAGDVFRDRAPRPREEELPSRVTCRARSVRRRPRIPDSEASNICSPFPRRARRRNRLHSRRDMPCKARWAGVRRSRSRRCMRSSCGTTPG